MKTDFTMLVIHDQNRRRDDGIEVCRHQESAEIRLAQLIDERGINDVLDVLAHITHLQASAVNSRATQLLNPVMAINAGRWQGLSDDITACAEQADELVQN